jgi:replicative DNA helicase
MSDAPNLTGPQKLAPNSQAFEEAVLGSILIAPEVLPEVLSILKAEDFYFLSNRYVWEAILDTQDHGSQIDNLTVVDELRRRTESDGFSRLDKIGGPAFITYLINNTPSYINVETYARAVERLSVRRRLLNAASQIAKAALADDKELEEVINEAEKSLFGVTEQRLRQDIVPMTIAVREYVQRMEELYANRDEPTGVPTGFSDLDKLLGGMQRSDLIIIAARPGVGKTSFMLSIALNAARARQENTRVAIFSLEMGREQLLQRFFSAETGINSQLLRLGDLEEHQWDRFFEATGRLDRLQIYVDDTPAITVMDMRTKCRRLKQEHGLDLIIVDYLQLMGSGIRNENRVQEISFISRGLKELARELKVPLLTAAQLSRAVEQRSDKRPQLSDLRESGCLAGETLIPLPDEGTARPIRDLVGQRGFRVLSFNPDTQQLEPQVVSHAFATGVKPVYELSTRLGNVIRATANHPFLTLRGWVRLDALSVGDQLAVALVPAENTVVVHSVVAHGAALADTPLESPVMSTTWDAIISIRPDGVTEVYDLTVPESHNFVANGMVVHNSIEQDADIVMFIYRDDMYNENTERPNQADIIVAKHRNGPTGVITLGFVKELTQFRNIQKQNINLGDY